jgi:hypothetical protein
MSFFVSTPVENTGSVNPTTLTLSGVPAGANINVLLAYGNADAPIVSVTDGTAYTTVAAEVVTGSGFNVDVYQRQSVSAGSHAIVITKTANGASLYCAAWYITGAGAITGTPGSVEVVFPGTGANIISAPATTPVASGALILSSGCTNDGANTVSAGTSPNAFTSVGLTTVGNLAEYFVQAVAAAITPTQGQTVNDRVGAFTWVYAPASTSPGPLPQMIIVSP